MTLVIRDEFTNMECTINNVTAFYVTPDGVKVYTDKNGKKDFQTTYNYWYVVKAEADQ